MRKTEAKDVVFVVGVKQFREVQNNWPSAGLTV